MPKAVSIIAHRGASHAAPENTAAAFALAWVENADGIETDLHLTRDGRVVCIHDATTGRVGGVDLTVADATLAELQQLNVGNGERIATLEAVLAALPPGKQAVLEIKCGPAIIKPIHAIIEASKLPRENVAVMSFDEQVVTEARRRIDGITVTWLTQYRREAASGDWSPTLEGIMAVLKRSGADGLSTNAQMEVVDRAFVAALHDADYHCGAWTVDDVAEAQCLVSIGIDMIITNRPRAIRQAIGLQD